MKQIKNFFSITKKEYEFEIWDLTSLITILNVTFVLMGFWWAPILGLVNCAICMVVNVKNKVHINNYITQIALVVLNIYFLIL